jgi:hypothetical protein
MRDSFIVFTAVMLCSVAWGQTQTTSNQAQPADSYTPGLNMSKPSPHDMSTMKDMPMSGEKEDAEASAHALQSMEGHIDMGPHMKMTALRQLRPGDAERAQAVVEAARKASEKYKDHHAALADGFRIFLPNVPQKMYHFTNYGYGIEAAFHFNPEHPTSLLYEKHGNDYKLIGVMYTAPKRFSEDQLDERIPLSVAQWHEHVNFCVPPANRRGEMLRAHPQFGLRGSISTQEACDAADGTFHPVVLNWMVHVYPFEADEAKIWSVERQHND